MIEPQIFFRRFPKFHVFSLFFAALRRRSASCAISSTSFSTKPVSFTVLCFSTPSRKSVETENNLAKSTRLCGDGIESPCSHELIPFLVIFILRASSACVHPRDSLRALMRSAVITSPLMSSIVCFYGYSLSFWFYYLTHCYFYDTVTVTYPILLERRKNYEILFLSANSP